MNNEELFMVNGYELFPFGKVPVGSCIAIYGAGNVGRMYVSQIMASNYAIISSVVDADWQNKCEFPFEVCSPDNLCESDVDYVVISVQNMRIVYEIIDMLLEKGFKREKIIHSSTVVPVINTEIGYVLTEKELTEDSSEGKAALYSVCAIKKLLTPGYIEDDDFVRVGKPNDGGYLMTLDGVMKNKEGGVAYSFGISDDVSWDKQMSEYGWDVYMYDHTISRLPEQNEKFHFFKQGISASDKNDKDLKTLSSIFRSNGHLKQMNMILKMDVEGAEYGFIINSSSEDLERFDEIVIELHDLHQFSTNHLIGDALSKLNRTHEVIHVHANNYSNLIRIGKLVYPDALEVTYVSRKRGLKITRKERPFQLHELDERCWRGNKEVNLDAWNEL